MSDFTRDDGVQLRVVEGFRDEIIARRPGRTPRPDWADADYEAAATNVLAQAERRLEQFVRYGSEISGARVLEVGCGSGLYSLALATQPFDAVTGIDLQLPIFEQSETGDHVRRLAGKVLEKLGFGKSMDEALRQLPLRLVTMDARRMTFAPSSFDIVWSGACLEHVVPVEPALTEMARVLTPGGLMYHRIDPFFWVRGCHRAGLVDIPWAHARMSLGEYERFVRETEGRKRAAARSSFLRQLNRFTVGRWREIVETGSLDIADWSEERPRWVVDLLHRYPEVVDTTVGVSEADLTCSLIAVAVRGDHRNARG